MSLEHEECGICLEDKQLVKLDPCNHQVCDDCHKKIKNSCPYCRTEILPHEQSEEEAPAPKLIYINDDLSIVATSRADDGEVVFIIHNHRLRRVTVNMTVAIVRFLATQEGFFEQLTEFITE